jgi:hypothetical protein
MKRPAWVLLVVLLVGLGTALAVHHFRVRQAPDAWLGRYLGLEGQALAEFSAAHARYAEVCAENCRRIAQASRALQQAMHAAREVTPEIERALVAADAVHTECRLGMLKHFYAVSELLDPTRREEYLRLVLPLVVTPAMPAHVNHP